MLYTIAIVMLVLWILALITANSSLELFKLALGNLATQQAQINKVKSDLAELKNTSPLDCSQQLKITKAMQVRVAEFRKLRSLGRMGNPTHQIKSGSRRNSL